MESSGPAGDTELAMSEENVEVVRRWWAGFNEVGMPPLALCDEEIEIRNAEDFAMPGHYQGHEGVRRWCDQVFEIADNARVEPEEIIDVHGDGETVLMLLRATGIASHTKLKMEFEWAAIWTVRDGKVLRAQGYMSRADALEAAGLRE